MCPFRVVYVTSSCGGKFFAQLLRCKPGWNGDACSCWIPWDLRSPGVIPKLGPRCPKLLPNVPKLAIFPWTRHCGTLLPTPFLRWDHHITMIAFWPFSVRWKFFSAITCLPVVKQKVWVQPPRIRFILIKDTFTQKIMRKHQNSRQSELCANNVVGLFLSRHACKNFCAILPIIAFPPNCVCSQS